MGTSTSWIAVEGATVEQVARDLQLLQAPADATDGPGEHGYLAAMLPTGWLLLVRKMERDGVVAEPATLAKLSTTRRVVGCDEESHVMYSAAAEWRAGLEVWALIHASEEATDHLETRGDLPPGAAQTRDELLALQAAADPDVDHVHEVPPAVAKLVVGYRLDSEDDDGLEYVTLVAPPERASSRAKRWWQFW